MEDQSPSPPSSGVSVVIRDVTVEFPFKPYDCQITYMERVIKPLKFIFHHTYVSSIRSFRVYKRLIVWISCSSQTQFPISPNMRYSKVLPVQAKLCLFYAPLWRGGLNGLKTIRRNWTLCKSLMAESEHHWIQIALLDLIINIFSMSAITLAKRAQWLLTTTILEMSLRDNQRRESFTPRVPTVN